MGRFRLEWRKGGKDTTDELDFEFSGRSIKELKEFIATKTRIAPLQQRLLLKAANGESVVLRSSESISSYNFPQIPEITLKKLGAQIPYNWLFLVEYGGPIIIYPLIYYLGAANPTLKQK